MRFLILLTLISSIAWAAPDVSVNGLFTGKAVLVVNGRPKMLKVGESFQGVKLLAADSQKALIDVAGKEYTLGLNRQIASGFSEVKKTEVKVPRSPDGHYRVGGNINGRSLIFVVDTGATLIAMSGRHAKQFGIDASKGKDGLANTASGVVKSKSVMLPKVTVGGITVYQVPAMVIEGGFPTDVLLGNSFLQRTEMTEQNGVLVLRNK